MAQSVDVTELIKQREHVDRASCQQWEAQYNVERTIESQQRIGISFVAYRAHLGGAQWRKPTLNLRLTCCSSSGFGDGFLHRSDGNKLGSPQYCRYIVIMNILSDTNEFHLLH